VDGDEDVRPDFSCPYCYEDFDITSLCAHLEDEHCFESKPAVSQFPSSSYAFHPFIVRVARIPLTSLGLSIWYPAFCSTGSFDCKILCSIGGVSMFFQNNVVTGCPELLPA